MSDEELPEEPLDPVHARLVALCAAMDGIETAEAWWPEDGQPVPVEDLPAFFVNPAPNLFHQFASNADFTSGQDWHLNLFVARFANERLKIRERDLWALCRPWMLAVPAYFNRHRRLELNDAGLVRGITLPAVYTLYPATLDRGVYVTVGFRMTTYHFHSSLGA